MNYYKKEQIESTEHQIKKYTEDVEKLKEVRSALKKWDKKTITIAWNKASGFVSKVEGWRDRERVQHRVSTTWKSWCEYEMHISPNTDVELQSRDTAHVLERVEESLKNEKMWLKNVEKDLQVLEKLDVDATVKKIEDMRGDIPSQMWRAILKQAQ